jgi:hypothetical protein
LKHKLLHLQSIEEEVKKGLKAFPLALGLDLYFVGFFREIQAKVNQWRLLYLLACIWKPRQALGQKAQVCCLFRLSLEVATSIEDVRLTGS